MDLTWLILLAIIGIVSSIASKRAEQQAKKNRERQEELDSKPKRGASTGPPVAPGPMQRPRRQESEPRKADTGRTWRDEPAPSRVPASAERKPSESGDRGLFDQMRRQLREEREAARRAQRVEHRQEVEQQRPEPVHQPARSSIDQPDLQRRVDTHAASVEQPLVPKVSTRRRQRRKPTAKLQFDDRSLRRAFVMKEILDKPISLREPTDPWDNY